MRVVYYIFKLLIAMVLMFYFHQDLLATNLDSAKVFYEKGAKNYDLSILNEAYNMLQQIPEGREYDHFFLQGLCLYRMHFIYFVKGDNKKSEDFGKRVVKAFGEALKYNPDSIETIARRGMVYQVLSGFSWLKGAKYGPKAQKDLKTVKKLDSEHFLSRFMDAVAYLESPGFFGGDTKKSLKAFIDLYKDFPNNEDVQVYLARAHYKEKKYQDGLKIIKEVVQNNSQNLFAQKLKKEIEKKLD